MIECTVIVLLVVPLEPWLATMRVIQLATFANTAELEKFLQLFTTEAYASAFLDRKKQIDYKHLSSVVGKRKRFDFLADFVPEKVKPEDALKEVPTDQLMSSG
ncbi:DNA polymerase epsilon subunit C [Tanacetum coccineum]